MNDHDKANLEFILSADKETLKDWYESLSDDEKLYAFLNYLDDFILFVNEIKSNL